MRTQTILLAILLLFSTAVAQDESVEERLDNLEERVEEAEERAEAVENVTTTSPMKRGLKGPQHRLCRSATRSYNHFPDEKGTESLSCPIARVWNGRMVVT